MSELKNKMMLENDEYFIKKHYELSQSVLKDSHDKLPDDNWNPYY